MLNTLKFIVNHPLNRNHKFHSIMRWFAWQVGSRLVPGPVAVPFVNDAFLLVLPGMTGATGNVYCGLHEFEDMAFLLHFLRPEDKFVDIGANIGSYTVLASKAVGCRTISIEPIPEAANHLKNNVNLNGVMSLVKLYQAAVGRDSGVARMSSDKDTVNHVILGTEKARFIDVPVHTLDEIVTGAKVSLIKMDVEGYEAEVLAGGKATFSDESLQAVIMENNGSGSRYGFDDDKLHENMLEKGFRTFRYNPFTRKLLDLRGERSNCGNTLYLRDVDYISGRLQTAPKYHVSSCVL